jgi:hypothetical protein
MEKMYLDDQDEFGLLFWYNDLLEMEKEMKKHREKD